MIADAVTPELLRARPSLSLLLVILAAGTEAVRLEPSGWTELQMALGSAFSRCQITATLAALSGVPMAGCTLFQTLKAQDACTHLSRMEPT